MGDGVGGAEGKAFPRAGDSDDLPYGIEALQDMP